MLGEDLQDAMASVYAEIAHRFGWVALDRPLSAAAYDEVRRGIGSWNGAGPGAGSAWRRRYPEPILLAVRSGGARFAARFTFMPAGTARRAAEQG